MDEIGLFPGVNLRSRLRSAPAQVHVLETTGKVLEVAPTPWKELSGQDRALVSAYERVGPPADADEILHRHGHWLGTRQQIIASLGRLHLPGDRIARYVNCGAEAVVQREPGKDRLRVSAWFCHDRWCLPCAEKRAKAVVDKLQDLCKAEHPLFITLTLVHDGDSVAGYIDRLTKAFNAFRRADVWKKSVRAAAYFIEVKRSKDRRDWHVHLHALCVGRYMEHGAAVEAWSRCTGGSTVVDIRRCNSTKAVSCYVTKYVTKPFDPTVFEDEDALDQCISALRSRRLYCFLGAWSKQRVGRNAEDRTQWERVAKLTTIIAAARRGEPYAIAIMTRLEVQRRGAGSLEGDSLSAPPPLDTPDEAP